jgi:hypothetical protein
MGNDHLYNFKIGKRIIDGLTPMGDVLDKGGDERPNADEVALSEVARRVGSKLQYTYDFGDCWIHKLVVEKRIEDGDAKDGKGVITCIDGEGACPPEDPYCPETQIDCFSCCIPVVVAQYPCQSLATPNSSFTRSREHRG